MASIEMEGLPSAAPAAEPWPRNELGDDSPLGLQADEMFARRLDTGFAGAVRSLVHDPATGLAGRDPEAALAGIAETIPLLAELKDRYLAQARGPRQKALLEPLIDRRLDRAGGDLGRIVEQATSVLDDRIVAERIADLQQDASLSWHDTAHLRTLGRTAVGELRYQGERKGWDAGRTDTAMRTGLSDLYAGAVESALGQDPERAAKLYIHARDVIQPERQAAVERRIEQAREERRVTEILGGLADTPDDPTRRPNLEDYQARVAEATPPDASPEVRAQISRMARIEQARADRAWQASRGRAATGALGWLGENPGAPLLAMPTELRDGLSPEQTEQLEAAAVNGGRVVTDRDLYDRLDDQAVHEPEKFIGLDLAQYRLSLGDSDYNGLTKLQQALAEGKSDPSFERHRLGRLFLGEGLRAANLDPDGTEARTARQQLDRLLGAFEPVEGKPPMIADIRGLVGDVVGSVLPHAEGDPNIARTSGGDPAEANGNTGIVPQESGERDPSIVRVGGGEPAETNVNTEIARQQEPADTDESEPLQEAQNRQPTPTQPPKPQQAKPSTPTQPPKPQQAKPSTPTQPSKPQQAKPPTSQPSKPPPSTPSQSAASAQEPGRGYGKIPQAQIEKGMTPEQIKINRDQAFRELTRQPLTPEEEAKGSPLPDDWETTKPANIVDAIKRAAERHGVPTQMFARLLYQEGKFNEKDKLKEPLAMDSPSNFTPIGYAQMNKNTLQDLLRRAEARGDRARAAELKTYSLGNLRQAFDAAAENLALNYKFTGSWPQAVAAYNVGAPELVSWLTGGQKDPIDFATPHAAPTVKWKEMSNYLSIIFRGAHEDPRTGDMYAFDPSRLGRTRGPISRPGTPSAIRKNPR